MIYLRKDHQSDYVIDQILSNDIFAGLKMTNLGKVASMLDMAIMVEHTPNATKSDPEDLHQETKGFQIFWIAYSESFREFTDQKTKQISLEPNSELKMDP